MLVIVVPIVEKKEGPSRWKQRGCFRICVPSLLGLVHGMTCSQLCLLSLDRLGNKGCHEGQTRGQQGRHLATPVLVKVPSDVHIERRLAHLVVDAACYSYFFGDDI